MDNSVKNINNFFSIALTTKRYAVSPNRVESTSLYVWQIYHNYLKDNYFLTENVCFIEVIRNFNISLRS